MIAWLRRQRRAIAMQRASNQICKHNLIWWDAGQVAEWLCCPCPDCDKARKILKP